MGGGGVGRGVGGWGVEGDYLKRGTWTVCRFMMGHGKKETSGVFEGGRGFDTQCTLWLTISHCAVFKKC